MRHIKAAIVLLLLGVGSQALLNQTRSINIAGDLGEVTQTVFTNRGITVSEEKGKTVLLISDDEAALDASLEAFYICLEKRKVILHNLANERTTMTPEGTPFRRQTLRIEADNSLLVTSESDDFNWVYDPSHPSALKEGPKAGYVAYPNINPELEKATLRSVEAESELLRELIHRLDPDVLISEEPTFNSFEAPRAAPAVLPRTFDSLLIECRTRRPQRVIPLTQSNSVSNGQTSVAMSINALMGSRLTDRDIDRKYGFCLLDALTTESRLAGYRWHDAGDIGPENEALIKAKLDQGLPVILALNGLPFSANGRGTIVTLVSYCQDSFSYADPVEGNFKLTDWQSLISAPRHPDGNFVFVPTN